MDDSFLQDLEFVPVEQKTGNEVNQAEKYITTRRHPRSITNELCTDRSELENFIEEQKKHKLTSASAVIIKTPGKKLLNDYSPSRDMYTKRKVDAKDKGQLETKKLNRDHKISTKSRITERKVKITEDKFKPVENVDRSGCLKSNSRESNRLSDGSSKENSRPSDSSGEVVTHLEGNSEWRRISSDSTKKKSEANEDRNDSVMMLNAIKEIVSGYTKMETNKIMKMMQDHYINSQASFMKQLLIMSDDIRQSYPNDESSRIQSLIQENTRLLEHVSFLKNRVEELQRVVETTEKIRQENATLKSKIHELEK